MDFNTGYGAVANFALVALGDLDRITIFTTTAVQVVFDIVAIVAVDPFSAGDPVPVAPASRVQARRAQTLQARARRTKALRAR